jgi:hypothetical protein
MNIFISYRRDDTGFMVRMLHERIAERFGKSNVFVDVDSIPLGVDFRRLLNEAIDRSDVLVALVGERWLDMTDETGRRRLDNDNDYVRMEIEVALRRDIPVIPVLVGHARMPTAEQLPSLIREFAFKNAMSMRVDLGSEQDLAKLVRSLESYVRIDWVECVNCCESIVPMADGTCPSCRRSALEEGKVTDPGNHSAASRMLYVHEGAMVPFICCKCAIPTEKRVKIRRSRRVGGESRLVSFVLMFSLPYNPTLNSETRATVQSITLCMPHCATCSKKSKLEPVYVNFDRRSMKFLVHRDFRRHYEEMNANFKNIN